ncbi:MAG: SRPBCC family protein [Myxococcaceae bacterium]
MSSVESVRKSVRVAASAERAFRVFTEGMDRWWPREHHIGTSPLKRAVLEPRSGGRWYAVFEDGSECDTGRVLTWEPPRRLVLGWQITAQWKFDPSFLTEVEVTFTPEGPKRTLVQLEHRNLERYGVEAPGLRTSIDGPGGWGKILQTFAAVAASEEGGP